MYVPHGLNYLANGMSDDAQNAGYAPPQVTGSVMAAPVVVDNPAELPGTDQSAGETRAAVGEDGRLLGMTKPEAGMLLGENVSYAFGPLGMAAGAGISMFRAGTHAEDMANQMVDRYRTQLAMMFGIPPQAVDQRTLFEAGRYNPNIRQALEAIDREKDAIPASGVAAMPGWMAGAAAGSVAGPVGGFVGGMAGAMGAGAVVDKVMDNDPTRTADAKLQELQAKAAGGDQVDVFDVMSVRIAQDPRRRLQIEEAFNKPFEKLSQRDKMTLVKQLPAMAREASINATRINQGADPADLMFYRLVRMPSEMSARSWTDRVGQSAPSQSFVEQVVQQRARITPPVQQR